MRVPASLGTHGARLVPLHSFSLVAPGLGVLVFGW